MTYRTPSGSPRFLSARHRAGIVLLALAAALSLAGCDRRNNETAALAEPASPPPAPMQAAAGYAGGMAMRKEARMRSAEPASAPSATDQSQDNTPLQRFLAVRQDLNVEVPAEQLADAWGKVRDLCGSLKCELLSSSLLRETPQQPGNAMLEMRVEPADVDKLLGGLAGVANVVSHTTTSEDKTAEVIDVEARIRNRTGVPRQPAHDAARHRHQAHHGRPAGHPAHAVGHAGRARRHRHAAQGAGAADQQAGTSRSSSRPGARW